MANSILTPTIITKEIQRLLHNSLAFAGGVDRQYDKRFATSGAKIGTSLQVRRPNVGDIHDGKNLQVDDVQESYSLLTVATQKHTAFTFSAAELTMEIDDFSERYLRSRVAKLASTIDAAGLALYYKVANRVGTAGTTPASALVWLQAGQLLDEMAVPRDGMRNLYVDPAANAATVNALSGLFNPQSMVGEQYRMGLMGRNTLGFDEWYMTQNVPALTTGTRAGTILVDGNSSATSFSGGNWTAATGTIHIDGLTGATDTIKQGETFTVSGVYAVNPELKTSTGALQVFTVLEDATAASNEVDLTVWPPLITTGQFATIDALPLDGATVTFYGAASTAYRQNIGCHKEAFALVTADLEDVSKYGAWGARMTSDGISVRIARQYDINSDNMPCRLDVLFGWSVLDPSKAVRVSA